MKSKRIRPPVRTQNLQNILEQVVVRTYSQNIVG